MTNRDLVERAVGVVTTFVVARAASRLILGISFPGTMVGLAAVTGAAICEAGVEVGGPDLAATVCRAQSAVNWPGRQVGRLVVDAADKGAVLLART